MAMLDGVTILDLSLQLPGPYATMLLRGLGARVIKVEPPTGDPARQIDPALFQRVNVGKELLALDLKRPAGRAILYRLAEHADAFVEGFRPGVMARLGTDEPRLRERNPRLVYCSLSGFGQHGPYADVPGHDLNYLGIGGGLAADDNAGRRGIGIPMVDLATGTTAALLVVAALHEVAATGRGRYLDVALLDSAVAWSALKLPVDDRQGPEPTYGLFRAADGATLAVGVLEDAMWRRLCAALNWHDWQDEPSLADYQARRQRGDEIAERLRASLLAHTSQTWLGVARRHDLPLTVVHPRDAVPADPQVAARRLFDDGRLQAPFPADARARLSGPVGELGADRDTILERLGWRREEIAEAASAGAFGPASSSAAVT